MIDSSTPHNGKKISPPDSSHSHCDLGTRMDIPHIYRLPVVVAKGGGDGDGEDGAGDAGDGVDGDGVEEGGDDSSRLMEEKVCISGLPSTFL